MAHFAFSSVVPYPAPDLRLAGAHAGPGPDLTFAGAYQGHAEPGYQGRPLPMPAVDSGVGGARASGLVGGWTGAGIDEEAVGPRVGGGAAASGSQAQAGGKDERAAKLSALEDRLSEHYGTRMNHVGCC